MIIKKKKSFSGKHLIKFIDFTWYNKKKIKNLLLKKKNFSGRNIKGKITVFSKTSIKNYKINYKINYKNFYKNLAFIITIQLIYFNNKFISLFLFSNGLISYFLTSSYHMIFSYIFFLLPKILFKYNFKSNFFYLFILKKNNLINSLSLTYKKGIQYVKSPGTSAKILNFNFNNYTALVLFSSNKKKIFPIYSIVQLGIIKILIKNSFKNTKAGYWVNFGKKPHVRGVAKNPVDHPHGGRTKSIKYPRTPWGKTTKLK